MIKKIKKGFTTTLALGLLLSALAACGQETNQEIPELLEPVGAALETAEVSYGPVEVSAVYGAAVIPETIEFSFDMDGRVKAVHSFLGQSVSKGDVILEIERVNEEQLEAIELERENLEVAWAYEKKILELELKKAQLIAEQLVTTGASSQDRDYQRLDLRQKELNLKQAEERYTHSLGRIDEQVEELYVDTDRMQIIAPVDAQVIYLPNYNEGDAIQAFDTVLVLADPAKALLRSEFVSDYFLNTAVQLSAYIDGEDYAVEAQEMNWADYMTLVMNEGTPYSYFDIDATADSVELGQYAVLKVVSQLAEDSLRIPVNSLYRDGSKRYVYVVVDNLREKREVEIGIQNPSWVEILSGLEEGEQVYVHD